MLATRPKGEITREMSQSSNIDAVRPSIMFNKSAQEVLYRTCLAMRHHVNHHHHLVNHIPLTHTAGMWLPAIASSRTRLEVFLRV